MARRWGRGGRLAPWLEAGDAGSALIPPEDMHALRAEVFAPLALSAGYLNKEISVFYDNGCGVGPGRGG
jgi:hypothetical protein